MVILFTYNKYVMIVCRLFLSWPSNLDISLCEIGIDVVVFVKFWNILNIYLHYYISYEQLLSRMKYFTNTTNTWDGSLLINAFHHTWIDNVSISDKKDMFNVQILFLLRISIDHKNQYVKTIALNFL